jgi:hypothetical protein
MADEQKVFIPPKRVNTDYPVSLEGDGFLGSG